MDRLWYTLALVGRLSSWKLPADALRRMQEPLDAATEACAGFLDDLGSAIAAAQRGKRNSERLAPVEQLVAAVDSLRHRGLVPRMSQAEAEALFTLSFAWQQISSNIDDLAACACGESGA